MPALYTTYTTVQRPAQAAVYSSFFVDERTAKYTVAAKKKGKYSSLAVVEH